MNNILKKIFKLNLLLEKHRKILLLSSILSLFAFFISLAIYKNQIINSNIFLAPLIPICSQMNIILFISFFQYYKKGYVNPGLALFSIVAGISYNLIYSYLQYSLYFAVTPTIKSFLLITNHLVMIFVVLLFVKFALKSKTIHYFIVILWFIIKAFSDTVLKTSVYIAKDFSKRPYISDSVKLILNYKYVTYAFLVLLQFFIIYLIYYLSKKHKK